MSAARNARRREARENRRNLSSAGATALDAIRVNGREAFLEKAFVLAESADARERA